MSFIAVWSSKIYHKFFNAYAQNTDFGPCCLIVPYLNLINPETRHVDAVKLDSKFYHEIPRGVRNGLHNGLNLVVDVESFDHAYYSSAAKGFKIAITNAMDKPVIDLAGLYIEPGIFTTIFVFRISSVNFQSTLLT